MGIPCGPIWGMLDKSVILGEYRIVLYSCKGDVNIAHIFTNMLVSKAESIALVSCIVLGLLTTRKAANFYLPSEI